MNEVPYILSLAYRKEIDEACKPLKKLGLKHFVMYLIFNDETTFILSNVYPILKPYYQEKLYTEDYTYNANFLKSCQEGFYLCKEKQSISNRLRLLFSEQYQMTPIYNIVRKNSECTFVFSAINDIQIENPLQYYKRSVKDFEEFCIQFTDTFIDLILQYNPEYRFSFVLANKSYRHAILRQRFEENVSLSERELECLMLAAQGLKSKDIAQTLCISPSTVETHLKHIRISLKCKSITQAAVEAIQRGLLGNMNGFPVHSKRVATRPFAYPLSSNSF